MGVPEPEGERRVAAITMLHYFNRATPKVQERLLALAAEWVEAHAIARKEEKTIPPPKKHHPK